MTSVVFVVAVFSCLFFWSSVRGSHAFIPVPSSATVTRTTTCVQRRRTLLLKVKSSSGSSTNFLLRDFETFDGETIDPYATLKVRPSAEMGDIKKSYRDLSRRYHPDAAKQRDILPGKCNNMDDVRDEWERIKLSYEILSNKKSRRKYDRHLMLQDPGKAMRDAAFTVMGQGIKGFGTGLWSMGTFAMEQLNKHEQARNKQHVGDEDTGSDTVDGIVEGSAPEP